MKLIVRTPEDLAAEGEAAERARASEEARAFLVATDWMVIRAAEIGKPVPDDVAAARAAARKVASETTVRPDHSEDRQDRVAPHSAEAPSIPVSP